MRRALAVVGVAALLLGARSIPRESPVADAAMRHDVAALKALIRQGADVNAAQGDGMTALHWAAQTGDADEVRLLTAAGARPDATTRNGAYTALHLAARGGFAPAVIALVDAGANVSAATSSGGATPLHLAAAQGDRATIAALLDRKAPVNAKETAFGQTPIMWAAAYDRVAAVQLLAARGADLSVTSKVEDVPAREKIDRAALQLRTRRIAALKAAENPPAVGAANGAANGADGAVRGVARPRRAGSRVPTRARRMRRVRRVRRAQVAAGARAAAGGAAVVVAAAGRRVTPRTPAAWRSARAVRAMAISSATRGG